jgi:glycosyltransferase involved in cell wall biosynthesis/GT2 family glycosyltransferase
MSTHSSCTQKERLIREALGGCNALPAISVVMPVYRPPHPYFERAVDSVRAQWYDNWQLCIADDASPDPEIRVRLGRLAALDERIRVHFRRENGHISRATNSAAELATGEFIAFLDQDDSLTPDCLARLALYCAEHPETDLLYSDDDKIDASDNAYAPQHKSDFDPAQMYSFMQLGHIFCVRRALFEALGGFRPGFEGSQDYDFALRAMERARRVGHIPEILYHWRALPGSTAAGGGEKPYSFAAGTAAVQQSLDRKGVAATAYHPDWARLSGCGLYSVDFPDVQESVTVFMPLDEHARLNLDCLREIGRTDCARIRFVFLLAEGLELPELPAGLFPGGHTAIRTAVRRGDSAALRNLALRHSDASWLVFLNADLAPHSPFWLKQAIGYARLLGAGCIGGKIFGGDGRIVHAGYLHGLEEPGLPGRAHLGEPDIWGHHFRLVTPSSCSAASELCLVTRRDTFLALGGFDAACFPRELYAADYCYRLGQRGERTVICPDSRFTCLGDTARLDRHDDGERFRFRGRHAGLRRAVNPHVGEGSTDFALRRYVSPERLRRPLRALMVTHGLAPEGAPKTLLDLAAGLRGRMNMAPAVWSHVDGPLRQTCEAGGISVKVLESSPARHAPPLHGSTDLGRYVARNLTFLDTHSEAAFGAAIARLSHAMAQAGAEVVFANTVLTFWAVLAAKQAGIPCVWLIRESEEPLLHFSEMPAFVIDAARRCFGIPYRIVFVAEATKRVFASFDTENNFCVIHNALDFGPRQTGEDRGQIRARLSNEYGLDWSGDDPVVLMLGSVFERKGQADFVTAWQNLPDDVFFKARYCIVGDRPGTPYSEIIHAMAAELPPERRSRVAILPETLDAASFYRAADIFVCCSRIESFPRVILEAMHFGLSIVTTPVYGIAEQIRDGHSALCYTPGDIAALNRALADLIRDPALRSRLRAGAKEDLSALPNHAEMLDAYSGILQQAAFYQPDGTADLK